MTANRRRAQVVEPEPPGPSNWSPETKRMLRLGGVIKGPVVHMMPRRLPFPKSLPCGVKTARVPPGRMTIEPLRVTCLGCLAYLRRRVETRKRAARQPGPEGASTLALKHAVEASREYEKRAKKALEAAARLVRAAEEAEATAEDAAVAATHCTHNSWAVSAEVLKEHTIVDAEYEVDKRAKRVSRRARKTAGKR